MTGAIIFNGTKMQLKFFPILVAQKDTFLLQPLRLLAVASSRVGVQLGWNQQQQQ
jgi:hypothetical protein